MSNSKQAKYPEKIRDETEVPPDQAGAALPAALALSPEMCAARGVLAAETGGMDTDDLMGLIDELKRQTTALRSGDSTGLEDMLYTQAITLQTTFTRLLEDGMKAGNVAALESFLKLAFKAQSQGRATVDTLMAFRNPPAVRARQANISNGLQQVNNGLHFWPVAECLKNQNAQNELLEQKHGERLDTGTQGATSRADPAVEAMEGVNGTQVRGR